MKKEIVGFVASCALLVGGYYFIGNKKSAETAASTPAPGASAAPAASTTTIPTTPNTSVLAPPPASPDQLKMTNADLTAFFTQKGGCLGQSLLNHYKETVAKDAPPALVVDKYEICKAFGVKIGNRDMRDVDAHVVRLDDKTISLTQEADGISVNRVFRFSNGYPASLQVIVGNNTDAEVNTLVGFEFGAASDHKESGGTFSSRPNEFHDVTVKTSDDLQRTLLPFDSKPSYEVLVDQKNVSPLWISAGSMYFLLATLPKETDPASVQVIRTGYNIQRNQTSAPDKTVYEAWYVRPVVLAPHTARTYNYDLFIGPKIRKELAAFENKELTQAIDYGFFKILAWPIYYALEQLFRLFHNWGVAIIVLTIALKFLFYPLTLKAFLAGKKMQKIQPKINALKEKYKDDKQKQSQEMMRLMSEEGANPMSGCLPILPQMPVFFALFAVLQHTFELRHAPFFFWIKDLSTMDPYFVSAVIMAGLMFLQQKLTPMPVADPAQAKMMQFLPLIFAAVMVTMPSGLVLYIITSTAVSILQQQYMIRKYHPVQPSTVEEKPK